MERYEEEREILQETIQRLEDFPKKIEYDVMIPLTKVAFCPGKIIHTNELKLVENPKQLDSTPFSSAYDIVQNLKEKLNLLEKNYRLQQQQTAALPAELSTKPTITKSSLKSSSTLASSSPPPPPSSSTSSFIPVIKPTIIEKKCVSINEKANSTTIIQSAAVNNPAPLPPSNPAVSASLLTSATSLPSPVEEGVFEIREFLDEQNRPQNYELLDVTTQLQYMENLAKSVPSSANHSDEDELIRELAMIADRKLQSRKLAEDSLGNTDKPIVEEIDDLIEMLDKLEHKQKERETTKPIASGWKQGFLSSDRTPKETVKRTTKTAPSPTAPVSTNKTTSEVMQSDIPAEKERNASDSTPLPNPSKPAKKAFSGVILEKY